MLNLTNLMLPRIRAPFAFASRIAANSICIAFTVLLHAPRLLAGASSDSDLLGPSKGLWVSVHDLGNAFPPLSFILREVFAFHAAAADTVFAIGKTVAIQL